MTIEKKYRDELVQGWQNEVFAKNRLRKILTGIKNESDVNIHNDTYEELMMVVNSQREKLLNGFAKVVMGLMR